MRSLNEPRLLAILALVAMTAVAFAGCGEDGGEEPEIKDNPVAIAGDDLFFNLYIHPDTDRFAHDPITLDGSKSYDSDGTIINFTWNVGGMIYYGKIIEDVQVNTDIRNHTAILTVYDNDNLTDVDIINITVVKYKQVLLKGKNITELMNDEIEYSIDNSGPITSKISWNSNNEFDICSLGYRAISIEHKLIITINETISEEYVFDLDVWNSMIIIEFVLEGNDLRFQRIGY